MSRWEADGDATPVAVFPATAREERAKGDGDTDEEARSPLEYDMELTPRAADDVCDMPLAWCECGDCERATLMLLLP